MTAGVALAVSLYVSVASNLSMATHGARKGRIRRVVEVLAAGLLLGTSVAALTHGEFQSMKTATGLGIACTVVLLAVGSVFRSWPRTRKSAEAAVFCGLCTLVAVPVTFFAARAVVEVDTWRAERYVASQLAPRLERARGSVGRYPSELRLWEAPPADAPWLIRRFNYSSDGRTYTLWVMDPGVCGRITSYSSSTRRWTETDNPCWY